MNIYEAAEKKGRDITIGLFGSKLNLVELPIKESADFSGSTINGDFIIEVKYRNNHSTEYPTDLLEYSKFLALKEIAKGKMNIFYLNLFEDGEARLYQLNNLNYLDVNIDVKKCPVSKVDPSRGFKDKVTLFLPKNKAKKYQFPTND